MSDQTIPGNDWEKYAVHNLRQAAQAQIGYLDSKPKAALLGAEAQTNALLAIAHEMRTANLIAWQALGIQIEAQNGNTSEPSPEAEDDIARRLGLGETDD